VKQDQDGFCKIRAASHANPGRFHRTTGGAKLISRLMKGTAKAKKMPLLAPALCPFHQYCPIDDSCHAYGVAFGLDSR
jgi:hypothetical protein